MQLIVLLLAFLLISCSHTEMADSQRTTASSLGQHKTAFPHPHQHGANCGHKSVTEGFDTFYIHDGKKHQLHAGHVDER